VPSEAVVGGELHAVAAAGLDDAWAVGGPSNWGTGPRPGALTEHWDGTKWRVVPSPPVSGVLEGVAVAAPDDVWAVGELGSFASRTGADRGLGGLVEHWDGFAWTQVVVPGLQRLSAVVATSRHDVWAVGRDGDGAAVVLRWAGSQWQRAVRRSAAELFDLVAISPRDVWAVGDVAGRRFLELHWNGKRWSSFSQAPPRTDAGPDDSPELRAVAAAGSKNVWAAGEATDSGGPDYAATVVLQWDGTRWRNVSPKLSYVWVDALAVRVPGDVVVAGLQGDVLGYVQDGAGPIIERRRDQRWQPIRLFGGERIDAFAHDRAGGLWAVGYTGTGSTDEGGFPAQTTPLIKHASC
jgi:hypothetical protein